MEALQKLQEMSNRYGADPHYVLAGGGNTSYKTGTTLFVKGSGTSLATIKAEDFVRLDRAALTAMWKKTYPENEAEREKEVLADMMAARLPDENRRPSVETLLHNLFPQSYVLHVHPALVNGMTCGKNGPAIAEALFPGSVWVNACRPGYVLASICRREMNAYRQKTGRDVELLFLQNHGVFFAGNSVEEIDRLAGSVMKTLDAYVGAVKAKRTADLGEWLKEATGAAVCDYLESGAIAAFDPDRNSPTPDHIVYCKAKFLTVEFYETKESLTAKVAAFREKNGYAPRVVIVKGQGAFVLGTDGKQLDTVRAVFLDQVSVFGTSAAFGGYFGMSDDLVDFIVNWEVESYRAKVSGGK